MLKPKHLFKFIILIAGLGAVISTASAAETAAKYKRNDTGLMKDIFDQNIYYEGTNYLRLDRLYRDLFNQKVRAANVNRFGEVSDSSFFINRHARNRMSQSQLAEGYTETPGLDLSGSLVITKGKTDGLHPGFFVKDARGDHYLLKFDTVDHMELATSAEVVASRFYYAIGYNVPQYTIETFEPSKLVPGEGAQIYDETGFKKILTSELLEQFLLFVPQDDNGHYRVSASKILQGENKGALSYYGTRAEDPDDLYDHKDRREIRALQVFASWLNNYDVRESNSLDMLVEEDGRQVLKHYLIDFNASLGSGTHEGKPPMFAHEHMLDYGEAFKAFLSLGFWEKPWQKRWRENGGKADYPTAVGYFDNHYFHPEDFKTQLPHYAFKDLTRADGFWAAKIIMAFTDEDIKTIVNAGEYSRQEDADYISKILIERRDIIGRYWFSKANPLDQIDLQNGKIVFNDLGIKYKFYDPQETHYEAEVVGHKNGKKHRLDRLTSTGPSFALNPEWIQNFDSLDLWIFTFRAATDNPTPWVLVSVSADGIQAIAHED